MARTLCRQDDQGEAVRDFIQTIFNSYASQWSLRGEVRGTDIRAEAGKVKARYVRLVPGGWPRKAITIVLRDCYDVAKCAR
jgi:hypothetical protein